MNKTVRSCLTAGVATMTAAAIAFVPSVAAPAPQPTATPGATVHVMAMPTELAAGSQPLSVAALPKLLGDWIERIVVPPSAGAPVPTPGVIVAPAPTSVDSFVKNAYLTAEKWVRYGFEWVAYGVGWIPWVGWLSPQVMIFYNLGESITRSIVFNVTDVITLNIGFAQGLNNVARDTVDAFIRFGNQQLDFWLPNFPRPPILAGRTGLTTASAAPGPVDKLVDAVSTGTEAPALQIAGPIAQKGRDGRLATFVQKFTGRATTASRNSVVTQAAGTLGQQDAAGEQPRPRVHGMVAKMTSAVRDLVSSAPHPVQDRIAKEKPEATS
jgi:hypothetical protein